jgi:hypothetical protein
MRARHGAGRHPIHRDVINPAILDRVSGLVATVVPLGLGGPLVEVDTEQPRAPDGAVASVRTALGTRLG